MSNTLTTTTQLPIDNYDDAKAWMDANKHRMSKETFFRAEVRAFRLPRKRSQEIQKQMLNPQVSDEDDPLKTKEWWDKITEAVGGVD